MKQKGEFLKKKKFYKRKQEIYDKINLACKEAEEKGTSEVIVDNRKFYLQKYDRATFCGENYYGFLRLRKFGLVFCEVVGKDFGWQYVYLPKLGMLHLSHTTVDKRTACIVSKIEDINTGKVLLQLNEYWFKTFPDKIWDYKARLQAVRL